MVRLSSLFLGFRWSLYICQNDKELLYAMHGDSVIRVISYPMRYFADGATPVPPWSLHLNFNRKHKSFLLKPEHFYQKGDQVYPSAELLQTIEEIDPKYEIRGDHPVFADARTKKELQISSYSSDDFNITYEKTKERIEKALADAGKPKEPTFYSIMDEVFGKGKRENQ